MTDWSSSSTPEPPRRIPAGGRVEGRLRVPSSKSVSHRMLNLGLLARRPMWVRRPLDAADIHLFRSALEVCGFQVEAPGEDLHLVPPPERAGRLEGPTGEIHCGNAGTLFRFLTATLTVVPGSWTLDGVPRLRERPIGPLVEALRRLGAHIEYLGASGHPPLGIRGGSLRAGTTHLDAGESSQYLSALLMASLRAPGEVTVEVRSLTSTPYVEITLQAVERFGGRVEILEPGVFRVYPSDLRADEVTVEGDFSAAAYPAAGAALTGGRVTLEGLVRDSRQGDRGFIDLLGRLGAQVTWEGDELSVRGEGLRALEVDLSAMPDQVPTLAALAPFCSGVTRISNVPHLRIKESDRLSAMATELGKLGAAVEEQPDGLIIPGVWAEARPPQEPVEVEPYGDHRIAMSLALTGLRRPGLTIRHPQVVAKSYPGFWSDLEQLLE